MRKYSTNGGPSIARLDCRSGSEPDFQQADCRKVGLYALATRIRHLPAFPRLLKHQLSAEIDEDDKVYKSPTPKNSTIPSRAETPGRAKDTGSSLQHGSGSLWILSSPSAATENCHRLSQPSPRSAVCDTSGIALEVSCAHSG